MNVFDDMGAKEIADVSLFKIATGGTPTSGEYKFKDPFNFYNYAKMTFSANRIPPIYDFSFF